MIPAIIAVFAGIVGALALLRQSSPRGAAKSHSQAYVRKRTDPPAGDA
jgi:hypothetical protein